MSSSSRIDIYSGIVGFNWYHIVYRYPSYVRTYSIEFDLFERLFNMYYHSNETNESYSRIIYNDMDSSEYARARQRDFTLQRQVAVYVVKEIVLTRERRPVYEMVLLEGTVVPYDVIQMIKGYLYIMHVYATVFWYQLVDIFPEDCKRIKYLEFEKLYITQEMNDTFFEQPHPGYVPDGPIIYEIELALLYKHYFKMAYAVLRSFVSSREHRDVCTIVLLNQTTLPNVLIDYIKEYL